MAGNAPVWSKNEYGGRQLTSYNSQVRQGQQTGLHQNTAKASFVDKQTGKYSRAINKEVVSSGETFKERSTGRLGYKDEYKITSTYRVGDRGGYSEYQVEERYRSVNFDDSRNSKNNNSGRSYQNIGGSYDSSGKDYSISNKNYGCSSGSKYGNYNDGYYNNEGHSGFRDDMSSFKGSDHNQYEDDFDNSDGGYFDDCGFYSYCSD